jgi:hypothetical protein
MDLTEAQWTEFETLAGSGLTIHKLAIYFNIDPEVLFQEYLDRDSVTTYHYTRGILVAEVKRDLELNKAADLGNVTALKSLDTRRREREMEDFKERLLSGS